MLGLMAMCKNFMLLGKHGCGKTRAAKALSKGYEDDKFVFYDATKDDLVSVAGIPDAEAIRKGELKFTAHQRSIWDKTTIVVDEISRGNKESQNMWLEILEERSLFGIPLVYKSLVATANPDSYSAVFKMDDALIDRFYAVFPVPDLQDGINAHQVLDLIALSQNGPSQSDSTLLSSIFTRIREAHARFYPIWQPRLFAYLASFIPALLSQIKASSPIFISPRTYSRILPESILAAASAYAVAGNPESLLCAAEDCLKFCLASKLSDSYAAPSWLP